jgi:hypothetical protein
VGEGVLRELARHPPCEVREKPVAPTKHCCNVIGDVFSSV